MTIHRDAMQWIGAGLALLGIVFVILRLREYAGQIDFSRFDVGGGMLIGGLASVYGAANILLALAWRNLLRFCGESVTRRWAVSAYGLSQLARYVPGNIAHFAGRQAIGASAGLAGWPLVRSSLWELGLISTTGALFAILAAPLMVSELPPSLATALFGCALTVAYLAAWRLFGVEVAMAIVQQAAFLFVSAATFLGTLALAMSSGTLNDAMLSVVSGSYVIAWLAGLVTPGAPAGLGVREFVLLFLLSGTNSPSDVLFATLLARIVSVTGDSLFFCGAWLIGGDRVA